MYTGTLIDDLMRTVERAETRVRTERMQEAKLDYWYSKAEPELAQFETKLLGVA